MITRSKLLCAICIFFFVLSGCNSKQEIHEEESHNENKQIVKLSFESIQQINLATEAVSLQPVIGYFTLPARVITDQDNEAHIGSLVPGRVHQVFVQAGDQVTTGQPLMTVESLEIGAIKAGFLKAKAAFDFANAAYARQKKLFDEQIGSQKALLESQADYDKALAEYKAEDKKIHSISLSDEDVLGALNGDEHTSGTLAIKSPINGIVVERNVVIGEYIDATTTAFKIMNIQSVWIDGQMYEKDLDKINQKTNVLFTTTPYPNEKFPGQIIYIGQTVDEQTRTLVVRGEFNNPHNKLKPNMFGELQIPVGVNSKALMIPDEAVVNENGQDYVFVQTSDTTFERRTVITGTAANNRIEIKDGLSEGERVISQGVFYLKSELKKDEFSGDEH
ncbi:MAG TPA: efflux RND transporter periplasmic adaptor subunit [bacterium]|nr:efflux RND transporter periplasmic adaptor subunit [bacterium]HPN46232.1 efflux RND transporter periplasmic adaptor subunit [bacterium]